MEQNPLTQPQAPAHDKKKIYISILIMLVLILGTIFIVRTFGTPNYRKIKENLAGKIDQSRQVDSQAKQDLIDKVNTENPPVLPSSDLQNRKQELINKTQ